MNSSAFTYEIALLSLKAKVKKYRDSESNKRTGLNYPSVFSVDNFQEKLVAKSTADHFEQIVTDLEDMVDEARLTFLSSRAEYYFRAYLEDLRNAAKSGSESRRFEASTSSEINKNIFDGLRQYLSDDFRQAMSLLGISSRF